MKKTVNKLGRFRIQLMLVILTLPLAAIGQEVGSMERLVSPEIADDNTVTFRIKAPKAEKVVLSGNWMPMVGEGMAMTRKTVALTKGENGVWSTTVGPLEPEL